MITGILNTSPKQGAFIAAGEPYTVIPLSSGQYVYLSVHGSWIPVIIRYSPESGGWFFQNLENVNVSGQKVMVKG